MHYGFHKSIKCLLTVFDIDNNNNKCSWTSNQHIIIIYEGSCDTENWRNAENLALNHRNKLHTHTHTHTPHTHIYIYIYSNRKGILYRINISQYYCFYCMFDQINAALVSIRHLLSNN